MLALATVWCLSGTTNAVAGGTGRIVVAGYGPELPVLQEIGRAFEKQHPGTAIDFQWDRTVKAIELVKNGDAHVAVTDHEDRNLRTVPLAWEGIAVIVNFANPISEVTAEQVKDLLTGKITRWSDLDGADQTIEVVPRAPEDNLQIGLERSLGLDAWRPAGKPVRTDEKTLRAVSGRDRAISYLSLSAALKAQEDGIPIRILTVDKVEPGHPTLKSGAYKLRRPVLLLTATSPDPLTEAFVSFATGVEGQRLLVPAYVPYSPDGPSWAFQQTASPTAQK